MMRPLSIVILLLSCYQQLELCSALSNDEIAKQLEFLTDQYLKQQQELRDVKGELKDTKQELREVTEKLEHLTKVDVLLSQENGEIKTHLKTLNRLNTNEQLLLSENEIEREGDYASRSDKKSSSWDKRLLLNTLATTSPVAFSTRLTTEPALGDGQPIEFKKVITNIGNGYDPRHGHFTAPVKGIYLMGFTAMNAHGTQGHIHMVRNDVPIAFVYLPNVDYTMGTQVVLVVLEKGDMVWIRRAGSTVVTLDGGYNTFSGALLYQME